MTRRQHRNGVESSGGWLRELRQSLVVRSTTIAAAVLMVGGQAAPAWAITSPRGRPTFVGSSDRRADAQFDDAGARSASKRAAFVERDDSTASLADTIATTSPAGAKEFRFTPSSQSIGGAGSIGASRGTRFELALDEDPSSLGRAFLVYDLSGLSSFTGAVRAINGSRPLGGFNPIPAAEGGVQVEEIPPASLHLGANTVEFLPAAKDEVSGYEVANLRVVFVADAAAPRDGRTPELTIVHPAHGECAGSSAYVRGFVTPAANPSGPATVLIDGRPVPSPLERDGSFSIAVQPENSESPSFSFEVAAQFPDGTSVRRAVTVDGCESDGKLGAAALSSLAHVRGELVEDSGAPFGAVVTPWAPTKLTFAGATIEIPAGAVEKSVRVTIRPLPRAQLAKMNEGMKNVTPGSGGYRFGPHGLTFKTPVTIKLPVDDALLPAGKSHEDVSAFFFDEQDYRWKSVGRAPKDRRSARNKVSPRNSIDARVASQTTHFTDFVNATLAVPEHPTAESFNENMMKEMKLGDPGAGITMVEPPSANSSGSASLSYPIDVPPGRNGIQPELAIRYGSDNTQDGWAGVGWDLTLPSIEVDTRFGAPAYDPTHETESYLYNGEALAPTAILDNPAPRSGSQKTFVRRVEGKFDQIVRFGSSPDTYYWVVTDQRGTQFTFGKTPAGTPNTSARLEAYAGAPAAGIFRWYLESVVDTFGNEMDVSYFHDDGNNGEPFTQTYPMEIRYTKNGSLDSAYHVFFDLERTDHTVAAQVPPNVPDLAVRTDRIVSGRSGFQTKTRFRLGNIRVTQGGSATSGTLIRSYDLSYLSGDFSKSLLKTIDQHGQLGGLLGTHTFSYDLRQNDPNNGTSYALFDGPITWGNSVLRNDGGVSRSTDNSNGGSGSVGVGIGPLSLSGDGGGFGGDETADIRLLDLNGDSLPDFLDEGNAALNLLTRHTNSGSFLSTVVVNNLASPALGHTNRSGWNAGGGLNLGGVFGAKGQYLHSSNDDDAIVADVNGDGLPDLVRLDDDDDIQVRLNDKNGGYTATETSCWGPGCDPTSLSSSLNPADFDPSHPDRDAKFATNSHLIDPVVRWVAPFAGSVTLDGAITKFKPGGDGVRVQIFDGAGPPFWDRVIDDTTGPCVPSAGNNCNGTPFTFNVAADERFYTKIDAIDDTHQDDLRWDTTFRYTVDSSVQSAREPFGSSVYTFSLTNDLRLAGPAIVPWTAQADGTVSVVTLDANGNPVTPVLHKGTTSDDLQVQVVQAGSTNHTYSATPSPIDANFVGDVTLTIPDIPVSRKDTLTIQVVSDTPIDPAQVTFKPFVRYTTNFCRFDPDANGTFCGAVQCLPGNPSPGCSIVTHPMVATIPFDVIQKRTQVFYPAFQYEPIAASVPSPPPNTPLEGTQGVLHTGTATVDASTISTSVSGIAMVQGINTKIQKVSVTGGSASVPGGNDATGEVIFTFYSDDPFAGPSTVSWAPTVNGQPAPVNFRTTDQLHFGKIPGLIDAMSGGFHRWFFGDWDNTLSSTFDPTQIKQPSATLPNTFLVVVPQADGTSKLPGTPLWVGRGSGEYIAAGQEKPARVAGNGTPGAGGLGSDSLRASSTTNEDFSVSAGVGLGVAAGYNVGETDSEQDFIDMNGDKFPDAVYIDGSRLNNGVVIAGGKDGHKFGGFGDSADLREVQHRTVRAALTLSSDNSLINQSDTDGQSSKFITTGFNFGVDYGFSATHVDIVDINGDGLPDHVKRDSSDGNDGGQVHVELNLGHAFSKEIVWTTAPWSQGQVGASFARSVLNTLGDTSIFPKAVSVQGLRFQDAAGANLGGGIDVGVVGGGGGETISQSRTFVDLIDLNGDGMPDQVMKDAGANTKLQVKLNLGDRFADEQTWDIPSGWPVDITDQRLINQMLATFNGLQEGDPDALAFTRGDGSTESGSVNVCIGICLGGSFYHEEGSSSAQMQFEDIDGDGKVDHVLKLDGGSNGNVAYVKRNHVDTSNLLVGVQRPLGSSITLAYQRDGNRVSNASFDMPNNQWVLNDVKVADGQGNTYETKLAYGNSVYNRVERENLGYDAVTTTRPDGSSVEERFVNGNQDPVLSGIAQGDSFGSPSNDSFYARGRRYDRIERDGPPPASEPGGSSTPGRIFTRATTLWLLASVMGGAAFPQDHVDTMSFYEGTTTDVNAPQKSTAQTRTYDNFGNVATLVDSGDDGSADDVAYTVTYTPPGASYIVRPSRITAVGAGATLRQRDAIYGSHGELSTLTLTLVGGVDPTTNAPYSGASNPVWSFTYDGFGNVSSVTSPGKTAADQHTVSYLYDDTAKTYRKQITDNDFGYVSTSAPNLFFGSVDTTTDVNGQSEHFVYDEFGRLSQVFSPRDFGSSSPTISINYSIPAKTVANGSPAYAVTQHKDEQHLTNTIDTSVFVDGLKRVIQTKKDLEDDPGTGVTTVGFAVSGLVKFDSRGRVSAQSQPRFCNSAGDSVCPAGDITSFFANQPERNPTNFVYDVLSRVRTVATPDGGVTATDYGFGTASGDPTLRRTKTVTDPNGEVRIFYQSVRDEILTVQEENSINGQPKALLTRYTYDPLSELLTVTDAKNNQTTATYDTLGQMVSLKNPDTGLVNYRFDLAGNLAAKETPNLHTANQLIRRIYSHGRLTDVVYPTSQSVHFTYGPAGTPGVPNDQNGNVADRVASIDDESGHRDFFYGKMGELVKDSRRLFSVRNESVLGNRQCDPLNCDQDGNPLKSFEKDCSKPPTYVTQYKRDSFDRLLELVYPDGEDMTYQYDSGGLLNSVKSTTPVPNTQQCRLVHATPTSTTYVKHIGYDEFGQRENVYLGNGVTTAYAYDPLMRRLTNVNTNRPDKDIHGNPIVVPLQRLAYTYDLVGNILSQANNLAIPSQENFTGPTSFLFAYDDLYELTGVAAKYTRETNEFRTQTLSLGYDEIGNITHKDQVDTDTIGNITNTEDDTSRAWDYTYAASGPHQVSQVKWRDPQPRPISQLFNGAHRDFQYDADGNDKEFDFFEKGENHSEGQRLLTWNEEDRLRSAQQDGIHIEDTTQNYLYDTDGTRTQRRIGSGSCPDETKYFNQYVVVQNDDVVSKHVYAGDTRIATTIVNEEVRECQEPSPVFYFHTDHLQSTEFLTDSSAKIAEHNEYFAFGETWIDERRDQDNDGRMDYLFTGKELDPETNLYYFGARYYDPQLSRWESTDPGFETFMHGTPSGGFYVPNNLHAYAYTWNNPVALHDPNGNVVDTILDVGFTLYDAGKLIYDEAQGHTENRAENLLALGADAAAILVPFATGAGVAVRAAAHANDIKRTIEGGEKVAQVIQKSEEVQHAVATAEHGVEGVKAAEKSTEGIKAGEAADIPEGSFSVTDWKGYPEGLPKPEGPVRLVEGAEYQQARKAANSANRAMHKADASLAGKEVHEIKPVKFGGSPTNPKNKIALTKAEHAKATKYWNKLMRDVKRR